MIRRSSGHVALVAALCSATAGAQECRDGKAPVADLGFRWLHCSTGGPCWQSDSDTDRWYDLANVPRVRMVTPGGPAAGVLRDGDAILSIEDEPTTSIAGGRLLARLQPGRRVRLLIERGGERRMVRLTAGRRCGMIGLAVNSIPDSAGFATRMRDLGRPPARTEEPHAVPTGTAAPAPTRRSTAALELEFSGEMPIVRVDSLTGVVTLEFHGSRVTIKPRRPDPRP